MFLLGIDSKNFHRDLGSLHSNGTLPGAHMVQGLKNETGTPDDERKDHVSSVEVGHELL
jgi:hypothetical protein